MKSQTLARVLFPFLSRAELLLTEQTRMNNNWQERPSIFVGRVQEQRQFSSALRGLLAHQAQWAARLAKQGKRFDVNNGPGDDFYARIFILHGIGGIGKTELTRHCLSLSQEIKAESPVLAIYDDVSLKRPIQKPLDLMNRIASCLREAGYDEQMTAYKKALAEARQVRNKVIRYKIQCREEWETSRQMVSFLFEVPAQHESYTVTEPINQRLVSAQADELLIQQMQDEGKLSPEEISLYYDPRAVQADKFVTGLKQIACQRPLVIALDTLEVLVPTIEPFLRDYLVLPTTDAPIIWILSGRHNIGEERRVEIRGQRRINKGYRDFLAKNPPVMLDMKTFSDANIREYLDIEMMRRQRRLKIDDELVASIKITTGGVPLAMKMVADALFIMPRERFLSDFALANESLLPAERVEQITARFLRYCLQQQADLQRVRGMALLLSDADADALREVWKLSAEQSVPETLYKMRMAYAFMRAEGLHDAVYEFVRRELRTTPALSEVLHEGINPPPVFHNNLYIYVIINKLYFFCNNKTITYILLVQMFINYV